MTSSSIPRKKLEIGDLIESAKSMSANTLHKATPAIKERTKTMMPPNLLRNVLAVPLIRPSIAKMTTMAIKTIDNQSIVNLPG